MQLFQCLMIFMIIFFKTDWVYTPDYVNQWVIWNIGQGQWVTHALSDECLHYDMGGEWGSFKNVKLKLTRLCGHKKNKIFLSHWDYDHFINISQAARVLPDFCWQFKPEYGQQKISAQKVLQLKIPLCGGAPSTAKQESQVHMWLPVEVQSTNEAAAVYVDENVLLPGDSPKQSEDKWSLALTDLHEARVLVLGHHGSRTSTGDALLQKLSGLKWTAASSRFARYGHPHAEVQRRLALAHIPMLTTEAWGNIWFTTK